MDEVYEKNGNSVDNDGEYIDDFRTSRFSDLFGEYPGGGLGIAVLYILGLLLIFFNFIPMISFVIVYLCHLCRRTCCMCKKGCSFVSLFFFNLFGFSIYILCCLCKIENRFT